MELSEIKQPKTAGAVTKRIKREVERKTVNSADAAKIIGVDANDVKLLIKLGYLRKLKLGATKVTRKEVDRFMDEATEQGIDYNEILEPYRKKRK